MYELIRRFWVAQTIHFHMNVRNNPTPTPSVQDTLVIVNKYDLSLKKTKIMRWKNGDGM